MPAASRCVSRASCASATDKPVSEIDTVERVEEVYQSQVDKPVESTLNTLPENNFVLFGRDAAILNIVRWAHNEEAP